MTDSAHGYEAMANALRRYCFARAHGRTYPEFSRFEPVNRCWVASDATEADGKIDGRRFRQERHPSLPWCRWLGADTCIASDHALQSFFELNAKEPHDWNRLLKEVGRNRRAALREWQREGREILTRMRVEEARAVSAERGEDFDIHMPAILAEEFKAPGRGMRSLKKA